VIGFWEFLILPARHSHNSFSPHHHHHHISSHRHFFLQSFFILDFFIRIIVILLAFSLCRIVGKNAKGAVAI